MPEAGSEDEGVVTQSLTLTTDNDNPEVNSVADEAIEIAASIDPGTTIMAEGEPYTGNIDPPRQVPVSPAVAEILGDEAQVFTMGSSEETLTLGDGQTILVTLEVVLESILPDPVIYYLEADGSLTLAGVDGEKSGTSFSAGGTILTGRPDTPETGKTTYEVALLLDHMSTYSVSASSSDEVYVYIDDGETRKAPHCDTVAKGYEMLGDEGGKIMVDADSFIENNLEFSQPGKNVLLSGGWNQGFTDNSTSSSNIIGTLTISGGCITIENIILSGQ